MSSTSKTPVAPRIVRERPGVQEKARASGLAQEVVDFVLGAILFIAVVVPDLPDELVPLPARSS